MSQKLLYVNLRGQSALIPTLRRCDQEREEENGCFSGRDHGDTATLGRSVLFRIIVHVPGRLQTLGVL